MMMDNFFALGIFIPFLASFLHTVSLRLIAFIAILEPSASLSRYSTTYAWTYTKSIDRLQPDNSPIDIQSQRLSISP